MRKPQRNGLIFNAVIFILLEFAAIALLSKSSSNQALWINKASYNVSASLWGGVENLKNYFSLKSVNTQLASQNDSLRSIIRNYNQENLNNYEDPIYNYIGASIVKLSNNTNHNYLILNKGSEDGVKPQSGIITDKGVVGIITTVDKNLSYGISFLNSRLKVSCAVGDENVQALLNWDGRKSNEAVLNDIPSHITINQGDTVQTSGLSAIFPYGVKIGVVEDSKLVDGTSQKAKVKLFQDFQKIHYVTIVVNKVQDTIKELEQR